MTENYGTRRARFQRIPKILDINIVIDIKIDLHGSTVDEILLKGW